MRFKSVLGAFLFVLLASLLALVIFVQTKSFGQLVTRVVSDISERRFKTSVRVKSFSLSFFPPGVELNRVQIRKEFSANEVFDGELGKIGLYVGLIETEEKKLTLGEIRIADCHVRYSSPESNKELTEIDPKLIKKIFELPDRSPLAIDTFLVENAKVVLNHDLVDIRRFKLFRKGKSFVTRFHLANLRPEAESEFSVDEVWGDGEVSRSDVTIYRLKVLHDVQTLLLKGTITNYPKLRGATAKLNGEAQLNLRALGREPVIPVLVRLTGGEARTSFDLSYENRDLVAAVDVYAREFRSNVLFADELRAQLALRNRKLFVEKLTVAHEKQRASLAGRALVYDFTGGHLLPAPLTVTVEDFALGNAVRVLGPKLAPLRGELSGRLRFEYKNEDLYFRPADGFLVRNLALVVGDDKPFTVLKIKRTNLTGAEFAVVDGEFRMTSGVALPRSRFAVEGFVNRKRLSFVARNAAVDLEDFGNIANLDVKGAGTLDVTVSGSPDRTLINLAGKTRGLEVLGYKLDETEKNITVDLADAQVLINRMESRFGKTSLSGNGTVNYRSADIALGITSGEATAAELSQILAPIFRDLDFLPADLDYKARVDVDIFGKYRLDDLKIRSRVDFSELSAYGENFAAGGFQIALTNRRLEFNNFVAEKGRGRIAGDAAVGLGDKSLKVDFRWDNLELAALNVSKRLGLNLSSGLAGKVSGGGKLDDYTLNLETVAFDTRTPGYRFDDSAVALTIRPRRVSGKLNLLGNTVSSSFNIALQKGAASDLRFRVQAPSLKPLLVAALGQHLEAEPFTGRLAVEGETSFGDGFRNLDLTASLKELAFSHPDFTVTYDSRRPEFVVRDSVIQRWDLALAQPDLTVVTRGEGEFGKRVTLVQVVQVNAKILDVLLARVLSAEGVVHARTRLEGAGTDFALSLASSASDLDLSIDQLPVQLNDLAYDVRFSGSRLTVENLSSKLDNGSVALLGDVFFDSKQPDVNLKFRLDRAELPILGKSALNISGEGIILGNDFPYTIGGEIVVNKALIVNELNEFSSKSAGFSQVRFLPKNQKSPFGKMFTVNLNVKAETPARITNSLMDVALAGEVRVFGSPARLRGEGRLSAPPNSSRIFFKNNEYQIVSADINFNPKKDLSNPDFDIQGLTLISTYKVYPKAYGDLERFNFDLTSDPALPRSSILSLIAFGYTDEIQNSLKPQDQQSLTQVGVGSFVFDRFKISDILNKQFGLQVNLGTVIEQSNSDSLLSGRSQDGGGPQGPGALGRTRSATRIELKKRLDEALTLSVSSTMGGSIGQRQSMNLNYGLSKNIQVEGVYELRTNEEGEADIIYNSIGGDLKFRRTFK
jgi:translocation and assembly module TamB